MPAFFLYFLKLSIGLAVVYLFYRLLLQRLTFYQANRWYLLAYPLSCFVIPFINVAPLLQQAPKATVLQWVPVLHQAVTIMEASGPNGWQLTGWVLAVGSLVLLGRLALQYLSLRQIKKQAVPLHTDEVTVYQVNKNIMPFSFANGSYVNIHSHSPEELQEIIRHEYVHVKQRHSADILLAELLCIVNWFNPFAWLLRHAIRQNLEFIADNSVVQGGVDKKAYQYLLLKVVGEPQFRIVNQFNFSSLKKRITMMNKIKSTKVHLIKFIFILPLVAVLLLAFRKHIHQNKETPIAPIAVTDTLPEDKKVASAGLEESPASMDAAETFMQRHPNVKSLRWSTLDKPNIDKSNKREAEKNPLLPHPGLVLTLDLANGKKDIFYLSNNKEVERFKKTYGDLPPMAPPPPPPAPPAAPEAPSAYTNYPEAPAAPAYPNYPEVPAAPAYPNYPEVPLAPAYPNYPEVPASPAYPTPESAQKKAASEQSRASVEQRKAATAQTRGQQQMQPAPPPPPEPVKLPGHIKSIHINNNKATVTLKDGTVENYNLNDAAESKAFQKKYGKLSPPPPPRPAKEGAKMESIFIDKHQMATVTSKSGAVD